MRIRFWEVAIVCAGGFLTPVAGQSSRDAVPVEPTELDRRPDLVGKEVMVDDHVRFYVTRDGEQPDELQLKRTPFPFLVPPRLRPPSSNRLNSAIVRGVLKRDGAGLTCAVTDIKPVTGDLDRLDRGLATLPAKDFKTRKAWALWAERRATEFKDSALL